MPQMMPLNWLFLFLFFILLFIFFMIMNFYIYSPNLLESKTNISKKKKYWKW